MTAQPGVLDLLTMKAPVMKGRNGRTGLALLWRHPTS